MKSRDELSEGEKKIETYLTFLARDRNMGTPIKFRTPDLCMYFQGVMKARS